MRLLYVIDSLAPGGAEMSLTEMAPHLVQCGIDLHVLPLGNRLDLKESLQSAGAEVHQGPSGRTRLSSVSRVAEVSRLIKPRLIHTTLYEANIAGRVAARLRGLRSSTSLVGDTYGRQLGGRVGRLKLTAARQVDRASARFASRFHAVSEHLAAVAVRHLRIPADRIEVIPRGRDRQRFPYKPAGVRAQARAELRLPPDAPVVIAVGRLERVKGLVHLMDSLPLLSTLVPNVRVLVAGKDGAGYQEVRDAAARSRVPVTFLGHRLDVGRLLSAADVLAFPSLSEGSPGTLIEAMATGCPIVASDIPPNLEVLGTGPESVGVTFPTGDPHRLARALASVLNGQSATDGMVRRARQRFDDRYEIAAVTARMVRFFESAASAYVIPEPKGNRL